MQAARALQTARSAGDGAGTSLDSLVRGDALAEHAGDDLDASFAFVVRLARALLGCGMPANRVEEALFRLAAALELQVDSFCMPTALIVSLSDPGVPAPDGVRTQVV